jgi:hypothetical protein
MLPEMSDVQPLSAQNAATIDPYSSKATASSSYLPFSSTGYNPGAEDASLYAGFGSGSMDQLHSPVQMFHQGSSSGAGLGMGGISSDTFESAPKNGGRRSTIYPVRATGDVNAINDGVTSANTDPNTSDTAGTSANVSGGALPGNSGTGQGSTASPSTNLSWQYELQQLRMQNEKMRLEMEGIEKDCRAKRKEKNSSMSHQRHPLSHQPSQSHPTSV